MEEVKNKYEGKYYIVRGDRSGVFAGEIESKERIKYCNEECKKIMVLGWCM